MALIELDRLSRHYTVAGNVVHALHEVSLHIEAGEMVAIMGSSGSGKSTLINLLGCLDQPSGGTLRVDGHDLSKFGHEGRAALRRHTFGFIFQRYHLLSHLDAVGNVELPAVYAGLPDRQRRKRAIALLRQLGLGDRLNHRPNALSGGQQQRVSVARALMNGGRIILADEPTGALDTATGAELLRLLKDLNAQGHTVILVTHDSGVAAHAQRIIELRDGRLLRDVRYAPTKPEHFAPAKPAAVPPPGFTSRAKSSLASWREALAASLAILLSNRLRAALSTLGIAIGIAAVTTVIALGEGLQLKLQESFDAMGSPTLQLEAGKSRATAGLPRRLFTVHEAQALQAVPGVASARLQRSRILAVRHGIHDADMTVKSVEEGDLDREREVVVQGRGINALDLATGASVAVLNQKALDALFPVGRSGVGARVMLGEQIFTVVGVTQNQMSGPMNFSAAALYLPSTTYEQKIDPTREAFTMLVHPVLGQSTASLEVPLRQRLHDLRGGTDDFTIASSSLFESSMKSILVGAQSVLAAVAGISLLVGGVGVMNIMLVSVAERIGEIGIRIAIGARQSDVQRQFLIESVLVCSLGAVFGLLLPLALAHVLPWMGVELPLIVGWRAVAIAICTSTAIGMLFGSLPAQRAARMDPVLALARE